MRHTREVSTLFAFAGLAATLLASACGDSATAPQPPSQPNRAPVASGSIPTQTINVGEAVTVNVASAFNDPDGDALTYTVASGAAGVISVSISGSTITLLGVAAGNTTVTVTAADPDRLTAEQAFLVTVETPNRAPETVGTIPAQSLTVGQTVVLGVAEFFRDPDEDALTYAAVSSPTGIVSVSMSGNTMSLVGVAEGTATVTVTATDPEGLSATTPSTVTADYGDSIETGAPVAIGDTVQAAMTDGDEDFFSITIPRDGFPLRVFTVGTTDTYGYLLDQNGTSIASDDDSGAGLNFSIVLGLDAGTYYLRIRGAFGDTGPYTLIVEEGEADDHGNSIATATSVAIGDTVSGVLPSGDEDFFRIAVPRDGFPLRVFTVGTTDTYGYLLDQNGTSIASDDDSGAGLNFSIILGLDAGTYYLRIRGAFGGTGPYTLIVEEGEGGEFYLASVNDDPAGITYVNDRFYVTDYIDDKAYAYTASGVRTPAYDFDLIGTNIAAAITYANDRFYVLDWSQHKVFAYTASGERSAAYDFDLDADNRDSSSGFTYANGHFYVTDYRDGKVFAYTASGERAAALDFNLTTFPSGGIKFARDRFYVVDRFDRKVYAYTASGARAASYDFDLDYDNGDAEDITYANGRFYVLEGDGLGPDDRVFAYDATGSASMMADGFGKLSERVGNGVESGLLQELKRRAVEADREQMVNERSAARSVEGRPAR